MSNEPSEQRFDLRPYLRVLDRAKGLIITFTLSAALTALALTYVFSEKYSASASILYQPNENVTFRPKTPEALGFPTPLVTLETIGNTLEQLAKSDGVISEVVTTLKLHEKRPNPPASWLVTTFREVKDNVKGYAAQAWQIMRYGRLLPKDPFAEAMATLRKDLRISRSNKAYTFQLEAISNHPQLSAAIVDCAAEVLSKFLQAERLEFARESRTSIESRLLQNEREIIDLRRQIDKFKKSSSVASLSEEVSLKLKAVAGYEEDLARAQADLNGLQRKRDEIQQQLEREEQWVEYLSTSTQNPIGEEMRLDLARLEVERSGLLDKYTEANPEVRSLNARIMQIRQRLASESAKVVSSESKRLNDIYQKLLSDRLEADANIRALNERIQSYTSSIDRENSVTHALTAKEQQLADLYLQLSGAERSYALIGEAREEARIAESNIGREMSILHKAQVPIAPVRPVKIVHVALSGGLSLILAIGLAFVIDFFNTTVRTTNQLHQVLQVPVLGTIPAVRRRRGERRAPLLVSHARREAAIHSAR